MRPGKKNENRKRAKRRSRVCRKTGRTMSSRLSGKRSGQKSETGKRCRIRNRARGKMSSRKSRKKMRIGNKTWNSRENGQRTTGNRGLTFHGSEHSMEQGSRKHADARLVDLELIRVDGRLQRDLNRRE